MLEAQAPAVGAGPAAGALCSNTSDKRKGARCARGPRPLRADDVPLAFSCAASTAQSPARSRSSTRCRRRASGA